MIRKGGVYRHMSCLDMDLVVLGIGYTGNRYFKLKVAWVNRHNGFYFPDSEKTLWFKDLWKWEKVK